MMIWWNQFSSFWEWHFLWAVASYGGDVRVLWFKCFSLHSSPFRIEIVSLRLPWQCSVIRFRWKHGALTPAVIKWKHLLALCAGNSPYTGEFPSQRPVTRSFDVFFDLRLNKQLSKQSWGWWFETISCPLWRHCNEMASCWHLLV